MSPENARIFQADNDGWDLTKCFKRTGHVVAIRALSVPEALEKIALARKEGVTVAILDNRMPNDGDGEIIAEALRDAIPEIRIISLCSQLCKPVWADHHFDRAAFSYETATKTLPNLIRSY